MSILTEVLYFYRSGLSLWYVRLTEVLFFHWNVLRLGFVSYSWCFILVYTSVSMCIKRLNRFILFFRGAFQIRETASPSRGRSWTRLSEPRRPASAPSSSTRPELFRDPGSITVFSSPWTDRWQVNTVRLPVVINDIVRGVHSRKYRG